MNWEDHRINISSGNINVPLTAVATDGSFNSYFNSTNEAVKLLNIKKTTLIRYINLMNHPIYSPALEKDLFIIDASKPRTNSEPQYSNTNHLKPITGFILESLEIGLLYAYLSDKETLFGIFDTPGQAALKLDNKKDCKYINRYINKERLVIVGENRTPVYFLMHPSWYEDKIGRNKSRGKVQISSLNRSIVLVDNLEKTALEFTTVSDLLAYLGLNTRDTAFVKKYMNPTKTYKKRYEFFYTEEFKGIITNKGPRRQNSMKKIIKFLYKSTCSLLLSFVNLTRFWKKEALY